MLVLKIDICKAFFVFILEIILVDRVYSNENSIPEKTNFVYEGLELEMEVLSVIRPFVIHFFSPVI